MREENKKLILRYFLHRLSLCVSIIFVTGSTLAGEEKADPDSPPPFPTIQSPVAFFRTLLETNQQARDQILSERPPQQRKLLEAKLNEYLAMPQEERELRLFMTELRWYLTTILRSDTSNRVLLLKQTPEKYQPLIRDRLQHWEKLPEDIRKELLENENALQYALRLTNSPDSKTRDTLAFLPPQQKARVQQILATWNYLPESRRKAIVENFNRIFELSQQEQEAALKILPPAERIRMENTLSAFSKLPKEERERCIASFQKFATMNEKEREQFLRNAAKWAEMTPQEREAWRNIVRSFHLTKKIELPPLPPGLIPEATAMLHAPNINQ